MRSTVPWFREQTDMLTRSHSLERAGSPLSSAQSVKRLLPPYGSEPWGGSRRSIGDILV